jgi:hypothetical protein
MSEDKELTAMTAMSKALAELDSDAVRRVLRWATDRYCPKDGPLLTAPQVAEKPQDAAPHIADLAHAFHLASPRTDPQRALIAAYWRQVKEGHGDWTAFEINDRLKNLGHRSKNITDALDSLMTQRPSLVIQTHKSGISRQARKKYKLTQAGIQHVNDLLAHQQGQESQNGVLGQQ